MFRRLKCLLVGHDWTCAAEQQIDPTPAQVAAGVAGFWDYAQMYCKRCNKVYEGNIHGNHTDKK